MAMLEGVLIECRACRNVVFVAAGPVYSACPACKAIYIIRSDCPHRLTPKELIDLAKKNPRTEVIQGAHVKLLTTTPVLH